MRRLKKFFTVILIVLIVFFILFLFLNPWGIKLNSILTFRFPQKQSTTLITNKDSYFVNLKDKNIYKQGKNQCGAFSTCFVLRNLDVDKYGENEYKSMSPKLKNGYLLPASIVKKFKENGVKSIFKKGNLENLKAEVSKGNPVIVIIGKKFKWQHYITITGYDENNIYVADSLLENSYGEYNKVYSNEQFLKLWKNNLPYFNGLYFSIENKK